jgi:hypothetical protein
MISANGHFLEFHKLSVPGQMQLPRTILFGVL